MSHTSHNGSMLGLNDEQLDVIFENGDTLALYLMSLSTQQIDDYIRRMEQDEQVEPAVRDSMVKLLTLVRGETSQYEEEVKKRIAPLAVGIAKAITIKRQIEELEKLEASL